MLVRPRRCRQRHSQPYELLATLPPSESQPLFFVDPLDFLVVHFPAFALEHHVNPRAAEASALLGDHPHPSLQFIIVLADGSVLKARPSKAHQQAGTALTEPKAADGVRRGSSLRFGLYQFFELMSLSARTSSVRSATICLSLWFSASSSFRRRASLTVIPPNLAFHL